MRDAALIDLAKDAGLEPSWVDFKGETQQVSPDSLRAVLTAMDLPCGSDEDIAASRRLLAQEADKLEALLVGTCGQAVALAGVSGPGEFQLEDGTRRPATLRDGQLVMPDETGYHTLSIGDQVIAVAAAPETCWQIRDVVGHSRLWGTAAQVYSLRGGSTAGFGDFKALAEFAGQAGHAGADVLAVSPVHALFASDPGRYAPYGPSTRLHLNALYADLTDFGLSEPDDGASGDLIDWPRAATRKWHRLHEAFEALSKFPAQDAAFRSFVQGADASSIAHARFEALDARFRAQGLHHWRDWTGGYADAKSAAVAALSAEDKEVAFHLFVQFLAERSLAAAQDEARKAGMVIGLISDLAVGMDGAGSHAWSQPDDILTGVGIGAPPDLLGPQGQDWGLTTFSPRALRTSGFAPFLATLRAAMRHAGGIRIDHVMGLKRLWVVPNGAGATDGLYLNYPLAEMLTLTALESQRHKAIVIGEDLGTVPEGFRESLSDRGIMGMRVLWFERTEHGGFTPPDTWQVDAVAMTTTHDLPTIAGWWDASEIAWRERIDGNAEQAEQARSEREAEKPKLIEAARDAGIEASENKMVDAAIAYVAESACQLAIVPAEDLIGAAEQPNLPGTTDEHPNWRRRLPSGDLFARPDVERRTSQLTRMRSPR